MELQANFKNVPSLIFQFQILQFFLLLRYTTTIEVDHNHIFYTIIMSLDLKVLKKRVLVLKFEFLCPGVTESDVDL